jgi:hypothetical protein
MNTPAQGTRWVAKRVGSHVPFVEVWRTTPNNVQYRDQKGEMHSVPISLFMGMYVQEKGAERRCGRCNSTEVHPGDKLCKACQKLIAMVRNARAREETQPVLTTTSSPIIEEHIRETPPSPPASAPKAPPAASATRWIIKGEIVTVVEHEFEVDASDAIGALAEAEQCMPGLRVVGVSLAGR